MSAEDKRFERSLFKEIYGACTLSYDIIVCIFLAVPLMWRAAFKLLFPKREEVRGKLALVTGAGGGLGRNISLKLGDLGCDVAVVDINEETAAAVAEELRKKGVKAKSYKVDISKFEEISSLRDNVKSEMGSVEILVNNAGLIPDMAKEVTEGFLEAMVRVNFLGTIWMTECFMEQMKRNNGGRIVAISSMSGLHASPFAVCYSATKAALNSYTTGLREKLRLEQLDEKIRLTCICPYYITTRKDIVDFLNPDIRNPPLDVDFAARKIVKAILNDKDFVTIPSYYDPFIKFINLFPLSVQQLARDRILKEFDFKNSKIA